MGEGEPFKAEQKKIADKWESDLGDRLGALKTKMQNKQPVSKQELDSLIQEAENWRTFKVGEPYKAPKITPQRKKLDSDLHSMGLVTGEWDVITQKDNHNGTLTIGVKAIKKYKTPSHIEADVFSETIHQPVGDMIKVRVKQSTGEIVEAVKEQPLGEPFEVTKDEIAQAKKKMSEATTEEEVKQVLNEWGTALYEKPLGEPIKTLENTTHEERLQVANTILLQMGGGAGKIKAMTGAKNFIALPSGVSFDFPSRKGPNHVKVTLEPDDTYTVEFGRKAGVQALMSGKVDAENYYKKGNEYKDVYAEDLKEMFERETGLYLSLGKSVTGGEQFVVSLKKSKGPWKRGKKFGATIRFPLIEKSKGGFRMARGEVGESEKIQAKKEQEESGEEPSQKQKRMSDLAKRRKEELGPAKMRMRTMQECHFKKHRIRWAREKYEVRYS